MATFSVQVVSVQGLELEWQISRPSSVGSFSEDMVKDITVKWGCFIIGQNFSTRCTRLSHSGALEVCFTMSVMELNEVATSFREALHSPPSYI